MEALEFMSEWRRMCKSNMGTCEKCTLRKNGVSNICASIIEDTCECDLEDTVHCVTEWSKEHPMVTNEMKVREVFGDSAVNSILVLPPSDIKRWLAQPYEERES